MMKKILLFLVPVFLLAFVSETNTHFANVEKVSDIPVFLFSWSLYIFIKAVNIPRKNAKPITTTYLNAISNFYPCQSFVIKPLANAIFEFILAFIIYTIKFLVKAKAWW